MNSNSSTKAKKIKELQEVLKDISLTRDENKIKCEKAVRKVDKLRAEITSEILKCIEEVKKQIYETQIKADSNLSELEVLVEAEICNVNENPSCVFLNRNYNLDDFDCDFRIESNLDVLKNVIQFSSNLKEIKPLNQKSAKVKAIDYSSFQSSSEFLVISNTDDDVQENIKPNFKEVPKTSSLDSIRRMNHSSIQDFPLYSPYNIPKPGFNTNEIIKVKVLGLDYPEVLVRKLDSEEDNLNFQSFNSKLSQFYSINANQKYVTKFIKNFVAVVYHENEWKRCFMKEIDSNGNRVKIFFMDYGTYEYFPISKIFCIAKEFKSFPQMCFLCSFADIKLAAQDDEIQQSYLEQFIMSCLKWKHQVEIKFSTSSSIPYHHAYFYFNDQNNKINFNLTLVKLGLAESTVTNPNPHEKLITPLEKILKNLQDLNSVSVPFRLLYVEGVSEFYTIRADQYQEYLQFNQFLKMNDLEVKREKWVIGELCLVKYAYDENEIHMYRGKVMSILNDVSGKCFYEVFAIDYGFRLRTNETNMYDFEKNFKSEPPKATRMSLTDIVANEKLDMQIREIRQDIEDSDIYVKFGEINYKKSYESLPVVNIYYRSRIDKTRICDIRSILIKDENKIDMKVKIPLKTNIQNQTYSIENQLILFKNTIFDIIPSKITSWRSHQYSSNFKGIIKSISEDGTIWIQSKEDEQTSLQLREELKTIYSNLKSSPFRFDKNLPVIFKHDDDYFYRGELRWKVSSDVIHYDVLAIDFGFVSSVNENRVFDTVVASRLPTLCGIYYSSKIEHELCCSNLGSIHQKLKNQEFNVKVIDEECFFDGKTFVDLVQSLMPQSDTIKIKKTFQNALNDENWQDRDDSSFKLELISNFKVSSNHSRKQNIKFIPNFNLLENEIEEFNFEPIIQLSENTYYVQTDIKKLNQITNEMNERINKIYRLKFYEKNHLSTAKYCLVKFQENYVRGEILDFGMADVKLFLLDIGIIRNFDINILYQIPEYILKYPCSNLIVKLKDKVKIFDIYNENGSHFFPKLIHAKVISYMSNIPEIEISV